VPWSHSPVGSLGELFILRLYGFSMTGRFNHFLDVAVPFFGDDLVALERTFLDPISGSGTGSAHALSTCP